MTLPVNHAPLVLLDVRELAARPWLPRAAYLGTTWQGPTGELVIVEAGGTVSPVLQGAAPWDRSIASAPAPRPRRP